MKKANGEGSVYFDKNRNKYVAAVTVDGKRTVKRFATEKDAQQWLKLQNADIITGNFIGNDNTTLGEWVVYWLTEYKKPVLREKSLLRYKQALAHIDAIANKKLQSLDGPKLQKFFNSADVSISEKHKIRKYLGACLTKAVAHRIINYNPMMYVELPKLVKQEIKVFTQEELSAILKYCKTNTWYRKYYPMLFLAINTGMRLGELLGLQHEDIHGDRIKIIHSMQEIGTKMELCLPKTSNSERTILVPYEIICLLPKRKEGYVFRNLQGDPIRPSSFEKTWQRILKNAGVEHKKFHALRHTFCSMQVAKGMPLTDLAKYVGHSRASFTLDVYSHATQDEVIELIAAE